MHRYIKYLVHNGVEHRLSLIKEVMLPLTKIILLKNPPGYISRRINGHFINGCKINL